MIVGIIRPWEIVVIAAGGLAIIDVVWTKGIVNLWRFIRGTTRAVDTAKILAAIADQFKPDDGASLHDRVVQLESNQRQLQTNQRNLQEGQRTMQTMLTEIDNKFDTFIMERMNGGRRSSDPHAD